MSQLEEQFLQLWQNKYPELVLNREIKAVPKRKFSLDFAHIPSKVGVEIQGSLWRKGGHNSGTGLQRDYEKTNLLQLNGWLVFQLAEPMITDNWLDMIAESIKQRISSIS